MYNMHCFACPQFVKIYESRNVDLYAELFLQTQTDLNTEIEIRINTHTLSHTHGYQKKKHAMPCHAIQTDSIHTDMHTEI